MLKSFVVLRDNKEGNVFYCKNSEDIQFDPNTGEEIFTIIHTTNNEDLAIKIRNNNRSTIEFCYNPLPQL